MKTYTSITELIGNTPILHTKKLEKELNLKAKLHLKLEYFNPLGSVKDRIGFSMIKDAIRKKVLLPGTTVIEPTSGNTGIALSFVCASLGYKLILTMPSSMSEERRKIMTALGATLVLTEPEKGMKGAIAKAEELNKEIENSIILSQFTNPSNPEIHKKTTAVEILRTMGKNVDILVCGVGTGGTITGVGQVLKKANKKLKVIAVEPAESPVLSGGKPGPHKIQGIGAGFVPEVLDTKIYDEVIVADYNQAVESARILAKSEGVLVGVSSGAALSVGIALAKLEENKNKKILIIMPDAGERYLSTPLFTVEED